DARAGGSGRGARSAPEGRKRSHGARRRSGGLWGRTPGEPAPRTHRRFRMGRPGKTRVAPIDKRLLHQPLPQPSLRFGEEEQDSTFPLLAPLSCTERGLGERLVKSFLTESPGCASRPGSLPFAVRNRYLRKRRRVPGSVFARAALREPPRTRTSPRPQKVDPPKRARTAGPRGAASRKEC